MVRQDERGKGATVEHAKLLRNRLEATSKRQLDSQFEQLGKIAITADARLQKLENESMDNKQKLDAMMVVMQKVREQLTGRTTYYSLDRNVTTVLMSSVDK